MHKPKKILWPPRSHKAKLKYFRLGCETLGIPVEEDRTLDSQIIIGKGDEVFPIDIVYDGGKKVRMLYDIIASRFKHWREKTDAEHFYFKTHMNQLDLGHFDRMYPMPQSTSNTKYLTHRKHYLETRTVRKPLFDLVAIFVNSDNGLRLKVVEEIKRQKWNARAWMIPFPNRDEIPQHLKRAKLPYDAHLHLQAHSRLNMALPGARKNGGASISFRHTEIWGIGGVCVSIAHGTVLVGESANGKPLYISFNPDLSDFVETINTSLLDRERCNAVAANGLEYFEKNLTPEAHVKYVLGTIQEELGL